MSEPSDIELLLKAHHAVQRNAWLKPLLAAVVTGAVSFAGTVWAARGVLDEIKQDLALQKQDLRYLREHVDSIGGVAIEAKGKAETAINMLYAAKGGYPPGVKP